MILKLSLVTSQINEINSLTKQEKQHLKLFKRYIDDTHSVCSGSEISVMKSLIVKILKIYPKHLIMNASLSLLNFSHLDSCGYTGFKKDKMTTFVRRNYTAPVNVVPSQSNCPASNKYSIILSELLRYRRMCSTSQFVRLNETHLFTEMIKAGYKKADLKKQFAKSQNYIKDNYDLKTFEKSSEKDKDFEDNYCGKVTYDNFSGSHKIVKALLNGNGKARIKPVLVPSFKINTHLISRKKHLKRLRDFVNCQ